MCFTSYILLACLAFKLATNVFVSYLRDNILLLITQKRNEEHKGNYFEICIFREGCVAVCTLFEILFVFSFHKNHRTRTERKDFLKLTATAVVVWRPCDFAFRRRKRARNVTPLDRTFNRPTDRPTDGNAAYTQWHARATVSPFHSFNRLPFSEQQSMRL